MPRKTIFLASLVSVLIGISLWFFIYNSTKLIENEQVAQPLPALQGDPVPPDPEPMVVPTSAVVEERNLDGTPGTVDHPKEIELVELPETEQNNIQLLAACRVIRQEWAELNRQNVQQPREAWERSAAVFRERNKVKLNTIKSYFGSELVLRNPADEGPHPMPPVPIPMGEAEIDRYALSPLARAFATQRDDLIKEQHAEVEKAADQPEPVRMKVLKDWEDRNEDRLSMHRKMAMQLHQLNFETAQLQQLAASAPSESATAEPANQEPTESK